MAPIALKPFIVRHSGVGTTSESVVRFFVPIDAIVYHQLFVCAFSKKTGIVRNCPSHGKAGFTRLMKREVFVVVRVFVSILSILGIFWKIAYDLEFFSYQHYD